MPALAALAVAVTAVVLIRVLAVRGGGPGEQDAHETVEDDEWRVDDIERHE